MKKIKVLKTIRLNGVTPKSTNNLFVWWRNSEKRNVPADRATKSHSYRLWREDFVQLLPNNFIEKGEKDLSLYIEVCIFKEFDLDNTLKGVIDALQIKYKFDDNEITYLVCKKVVKGTFDSQQPNEHYIKISTLETFEMDMDESKHIETHISQKDISTLDAHRNYDIYDKGINEEKPLKLKFKDRKMKS